MPKEMPPVFTERGVNEDFLAVLSEQARSSERGRAAYPLKKPEDPVQDILNALEPWSYMQPHKHSEKGETRIGLVGKVAVVLFEDNGEVAEVIILTEGTETYVAPGIYHMLVSLESGSAIRAIIDGPYDEKSHKEVTLWAPSEEDSDQGQTYLKEIRAKISSFC